MAHDPLDPDLSTLGYALEIQPAGHTVWLAGHAVDVDTSAPGATYAARHRRAMDAAREHHSRVTDPRRGVMLAHPELNSPNLRLLAARPDYLGLVPLPGELGYVGWRASDGLWAPLFHGAATRWPGFQRPGAAPILVLLRGVDDSSLGWFLEDGDARALTALLLAASPDEVHALLRAQPPEHLN